MSKQKQTHPPNTGIVIISNRPANSLTMRLASWAINQLSWVDGVVTIDYGFDHY